MERVEIPAGLTISTTTPPRVDNAALVRRWPARAAAMSGPAEHRLVVLGDSVSQGFKSGAIHDTSLSWPAQVARAIGWGSQFRYATYGGPAHCPGLPTNIEELLRTLESEAGAGPLVSLRSAEVAAKGLETLFEVKKYWLSGKAAPERPATQPLMHNLAIYGWDVRDAISKDAKWCVDHLVKPSRFDPMVSDNNWRAAIRVLVGPLGGGTSQVTAAQELGRDGGIETLVVALGANNALGSVLDVKLTWTPDDYPTWDPATRLAKKDAFTVWTPAAFDSDYADLMTEIRKVQARHVVLATVPHVTVLPLLHGFGDKPTGSRYFTRYSRVWLNEEEFDANDEQSLTGEQCRVIDSAIDSYNATIVSYVEQARERAGLDWHVFDLCALLDSLAYRRYLADPSVKQPVTPYVLPPALQALSPRPDTRFFGSDRYGRLQGGLVALDGIHPTTIGYGLIAHEFLEILGDAGVVTQTPIDFTSLIEQDTLISDPPRTLTADMKTLGFLVEKLHVLESMLDRSAHKLG